MTERSPRAATDAKGRVRAALVESLLSAHREGKLAVTIGRASDYFGPRCENSGIAALVMGPAAAGRAMQWLGALDAPHSLAYLPDVARAYVALGSDPGAAGRVWHLPHAPAVTGAQFLALVNQAMVQPVPARRMGVGMLRIAARFNRMARESLGVAYQWSAPFVVDDSDFRERYPFTSTPLDEAVRTTLGGLGVPLQEGADGAGLMSQPG